MHDLVLRGGTVIDGTGSQSFTADVAIDGGVITYVGPDAGRGTEEIDAQGHIVTPGFVDLHTHYDAQVMWDPILAPSAWHGVTTVITGNCGVGFAPVRPQDHALLVEIMESVEEIPIAVMNAGLQWNWESYPDYLDAVEARAHTVDIGSQLPHIALRTFVMGERAQSGAQASATELAAMSDLVEEGLRAGALGFACSRTEAHRLANGELVPGSFADVDELLTLADAVARVGNRVVQFLGILGDATGDFPLMKNIARRSEGAVHFLMSDTHWHAKLAEIEQAEREGVKLVGHVPPRAVGNVLQWRAGRHPFMDRPSIKAMAHLPWETQLAQLSDPAFRARVLSENNGEGEELLPPYARLIYRGFERMYEVDDYPNYEPDPQRDSIAARAEQCGQDAVAYAYDVMMRNNGQGMIYMTLSNYRAGDFSEVGELISQPHIVASLSDGGAHCTRVVDASAPTFMLTHWGRDRTRGDKFPLEKIVKMLSRDVASAYGLHDRGVIAPGYLADLNIIDFAKLQLPAPFMRFDFPAGGKRLLQQAEGYVATIKRGQITFRNGEHCGRFPGKLVRGPQAAPLLT